MNSDIIYIFHYLRLGKTSYAKISFRSLFKVKPWAVLSSVFNQGVYVLYYWFNSQQFSDSFLIWIQLSSSKKAVREKKCPENIASESIISLPLHNILLHSFLKLSFVSNLEKLWFSAKSSENPRFWKVWVHLFTVLSGIKCAGWWHEGKKTQQQWCDKRGES